MTRIIIVAGNTLGAIGIGACAVTGLARLSGMPALGGFEGLTIFIGGIAMISTACLLKLHAMEATLGTRSGHR